MRRTAGKTWVKTLCAMLAALFTAGGACLVIYFGFNYNYAWFAPRVPWIIAGGCVCGALAAALFAFLVYAAGRRENGETALRWIDKIPCDLFTAVMAIPVLCVAAAVTDYLGYYSPDEYYIYTYLLSGAAAIAEALFVIVFFMSWAARIRFGRFWKNSIVFFILRRLKKPCRRLACIAKALPLMWQSALIAFVLLVLQFIAYEDRSSLLWLIVNAAVALAIMGATLDMRKLREGAKALAAGNFETRVDTEPMHWQFKAHGEDLNRIGEGIALAVERQMKSERMKTELITNVSHDIKTPLTSIINYVDLLKKEDVKPEKAVEYIGVLDRQSQRLRKLTEDVVEASKAATGNIPVELAQTDMNVLLTQAAGEYEDKLSAHKLELVLELSDKPNYVMADGRLLWRVFDNLMGNAVKYAMPGTRVYVSSRMAGGRAEAVFKNISAAQLNISADELMERFTRGDESRSTEGSGLGLSIAASLAALQNGKCAVDIDGDLFKATVGFAACGDPE